MRRTAARGKDALSHMHTFSESQGSCCFKLVAELSGYWYRAARMCCVSLAMVSFLSFVYLLNYVETDVSDDSLEATGLGRDANVTTGKGRDVVQSDASAAGTPGYVHMLWQMIFTDHEEPDDIEVNVGEATALLKEIDSVLDRLKIRHEGRRLSERTHFDREFEVRETARGVHGETNVDDDLVRQAILDVSLRRESFSRRFFRQEGIPPGEQQSSKVVSSSGLGPFLSATELGFTRAGSAGEFLRARWKEKGVELFARSGQAQAFGVTKEATDADELVTTQDLRIAYGHPHAISHTHLDDANIKGDRESTNADTKTSTPRVDGSDTTIPSSGSSSSVGATELGDTRVTRQATGGADIHSAVTPIPSSGLVSSVSVTELGDTRVTRESTGDADNQSAVTPLPSSGLASSVSATELGDTRVTDSQEAWQAEGNERGRRNESLSLSVHVQEVQQVSGVSRLNMVRRSLQAKAKHAVKLITREAQFRRWQDCNLSKQARKLQSRRMRRLKHRSKDAHRFRPSVWRKWLPLLSLFAMVSALICYMFPGGPRPNMHRGGPRQHSHVGDAGPPFVGTATIKVPPAWSIERNHHYSLRAWISDLILWSTATDVEAHRMGAIAALQVSGSAKELVRELPPDQLANGVIDPQTGNQITGLMLLVRTLANRYAPLEGEASIKAVSDFLNFSRLPGESVDAFLVRFDALRNRAHVRGGLGVNASGLSWLLLKALNLSADLVDRLLQPLGGQLPQDDPQLGQLLERIRRQGHLFEGAMRHSSAQAGTGDPGAYLAFPTFNSNMVGHSQEPVRDNGRASMGIDRSWCCICLWTGCRHACVS